MSAAVVIAFLMCLFFFLGYVFRCVSSSATAISMTVGVNYIDIVDL